jgi:hypothetical protein
MFVVLNLAFVVFKLGVCSFLKFESHVTRGFEGGLKVFKSFLKE